MIDDEVAVRQTVRTELPDQSLSPAQASEAHFRSIFERAPLGIVILGMDGRPRACNPATEQLFGYPEAELTAMHFKDLTHPEDVGDALAMYQAMVQGTRENYQADRRYVRKGGEVISTRINVSLMRDPTGRPSHLLAMIEDVTADRAAEERLKLALSAAGMGIWEWDLASDRVIWSGEIEKIAGLETGEMPKTFAGFRRLVHVEDRKVLERALVRAVGADGQAGDFEAEFRLRRPDGSMRWVAIVGRVQRDPDGRSRSILGMAHDVSGLRQLEQQFRQSQKMEAMGLLAGGVAHDFNNLLTAIQGNSEFLLRWLVDPARRDEAQQIAEAAERAAGLTRQLLAFSRRQILTPRVVDANTIVRGMEKLLTRLIGSDIELRVSLAEGRHPVRVDPGQLEQVIMNLAVNARDAMPEGGVITIETSAVEFDETVRAERADIRAGRYALIAVADTGVGMTAEVKQRLFEPFFTTKEIGHGTGLGLATVYGIVQQSHGAIWVYSEPGQGSTFKVYLPWVEAELAPNADAPNAPRPVHGSELVLVVDDDPHVRALSERALSEHGYQVTTAANGREALAVIESADDAFDLLITDIVMPGMRGTALAGRARSTGRVGRVLFVTGYTDRAVDDLHPRDGILPKPFTPTTLLRAVRDLLDAP